MACICEHCNSERTEICWPISVWHPKALRFFNGQSNNVSSNGALVVLPMSVPIREGQDLEINFPRTEPVAHKKGQFARIKKGRVIRVDRSESLNSAKVKIALEFYGR
jgi:hypothetical protein